MKPFNLEAAKRGEPIISSDGALWHFVGVNRSLLIVVENGNGELNTFHASHLYMEPKKRTVWVNFYKGIRDAEYFSTKEMADSESEYRAKICGRPRIGGKAYPVEIEE